MIVGRRHTERKGRLVGTDPAEAFTREGQAPCFVAFHGFTGTTSEIRFLLDRIAEQGFAVHAPLLPGHGSSAATLQDTTFDAIIDAMKAELDAMLAKYERVVLCGFSLGSLVALELATHRPKGLLGVVALGNAVTLTPAVRGPLGFVDRRAWKLPDWYLLKLWSSDVRDPEMKKRVVSYDRDPLRAALEVYRAGRRVEPRLGLIDQPLLVIHGGKDRVCPPANAGLVARSVSSRDVETKLYPRSGHLVACDLDRNEVADDVVRFVSRLSQ